MLVLLSCLGAGSKVKGQRDSVSWAVLDSSVFISVRQVSLDPGAENGFGDVETSKWGT